MLNKNKSKPYFIVFLISILTSLINPYGIKYLCFIFNALILNREHITEWHSVFFYPYFKFFMIKYKIFVFCILPFFIYLIAKTKNLDKTKYSILLFTFLISIKSLRFHVFFVYSFIALCYNDFYNIFKKRLPLLIDNLKEIVLCILIFVSSIYHIYNYKFINQVYGEYPSGAVEFIKINNLKGNILTNFHFGSYVSYKLYPKVHIFMDGRYEETYDIDLINQMRNFYLGNLDFLKKYHVDILLLEKEYPIFEKMKKDWFLAYEDETFGVFLPLKFKERKFLYPTKDGNYYNSEKFKTEINWE